MTVGRPPLPFRLPAIRTRPRCVPLRGCIGAPRGRGRRCVCVGGRGGSMCRTSALVRHSSDTDVPRLMNAAARRRAEAEGTPPSTRRGSSTHGDAHAARERATPTRHAHGDGTPARPVAEGRAGDGLCFQGSGMCPRVVLGPRSHRAWPGPWVWVGTPHWTRALGLCQLERSNIEKVHFHIVVVIQLYISINITILSLHLYYY